MKTKIQNMQKHYTRKPDLIALICAGSLMLLIFAGALSGCGEGAAKDGPRNQIMGTGEKTKIGPLNRDDQFLEAVRKNDLKGVRAHLAKGANIAARDGLNSTALLLAVRKTNNAELLRFLAAKGASVPGFIDTPDNLGRTPLSWASQWGRVSAMTFLLKKGAALDKADKSGRTPLFHAVLAGRANALKLLLARGANPNPRDKFGDTPLSIAGVKGRANIVSILLAGGADKSIRNQEGKTAHERARDPGIKRMLK